MSVIVFISNTHPTVEWDIIVSYEIKIYSKNSYMGSNDSTIINHNKGGSWHKVYHYGERVIFFIRHFSS